MLISDSLSLLQLRFLRCKHSAMAPASCLPAALFPTMMIMDQSSEIVSKFLIICFALYVVLFMWSPHNNLDKTQERISAYNNLSSGVTLLLSSFSDRFSPKAYDLSNLGYLDMLTMLPHHTHTMDEGMNLKSKQELASYTYIISFTTALVYFAGRSLW